METIFSSKLRQMGRGLCHEIFSPIPLGGIFDKTMTTVDIIMKIYKDVEKQYGPWRAILSVAFIR